MKTIAYFFKIQVCFSIITIVNSYVITDTTIEHDVQVETIEFERKEQTNKYRRSLATNDSNNLWDEGIIPYKFDNTYTGQQGCSKTLLEPKGIFSPPTQKDSQLDDHHCQWTIRAAEGHRIKLSIKSLNVRESLDCSTDYLEIRNGYRNSNEVKAHYCGKYVTPLIVDSNIVQVLLIRTLVEYDEPAFVIEYEAICSNDIYIERNDTFYLESPNYPARYGPNKRCHWYINVPEDHSISIVFDHFDLQDSPDCKSDVLEAEEFDYFLAPINKIYCGKNDTLKITSARRLMLLRFITDESINGNGFSAVITAQQNNAHN